MTNWHDCPCCHMDFDFDIWVDDNNRDETATAFNRCAAADVLYERLKETTAYMEQVARDWPLSIYPPIAKNKAALALVDGERVDMIIYST